MSSELHPSFLNFKIQSSKCKYFVIFQWWLSSGPRRKCIWTSRWHHRVLPQEVQPWGVLPWSPWHSCRTILFFMCVGGCVSHPKLNLGLLCHYACVAKMAGGALQLSSWCTRLHLWCIPHSIDPIKILTCHGGCNHFSTLSHNIRLSTTSYCCLSATVCIRLSDDLSAHVGPFLRASTYCPSCQVAHDEETHNHVFSGCWCCTNANVPPIL